MEAKSDLESGVGVDAVSGRGKEDEFILLLPQVPLELKAAVDVTVIGTQLLDDLTIEERKNDVFPSTF